VLKVLLANLSQAAKVAKRDIRVSARGISASQFTARVRLIAAAEKNFVSVFFRYLDIEIDASQEPKQLLRSYLRQLLVGDISHENPEFAERLVSA
jgi:hypothetical protein